jgi:pantoate--beta-alanine ligase
MKIIRIPARAQEYIKGQKLSGKSIGLVPTMGALHEGHMSLIRRARKENDVVAVSIFVNPAQFGPGEDYLRYPRPFSKDSAMCRAAGVDVVFTPSAAAMYGGSYLTYINVEKITDPLCGRFRQGHFRGVATVVAKLFNILMPDRAYFGLKDYQQALVIKKMVSDLNFPVDVVACPTIRENDGLALSSRNVFLSANERSRALSLSRSLQLAENLIKYKKMRVPGAVRSEMVKHLAGNADRIDYVDVRDAETLEEPRRIKPGQKIVVAIAAFVGKTRLIDNKIIRA